MPFTFDYLILTASNDRQAAGYESQLALRRRAGLLPEVGAAMVVADPLGRRVGSGGSTLYCLMRVIEAEVRRTGRPADDWPSVQRLLQGLRVLILHAGGDSRRVPAYGPCGKIFSPVPGREVGPAPFPPSGSPHSVAAETELKSGPSPCDEVISTLFDRLYPVFRDMPRGATDAGQIIVAAGDALLLFDNSAVRFDRPGVIALGAYATPEAASKHGVFCVAPDGGTRLFLQKPPPAEQRRLGAVDAQGRAVLDIGVMSFDAATAVAWFHAFDVRLEPEALQKSERSSCGPRFSAEMEKLVLDCGLDLYREICCALGSEATSEHHRASSLASGSHWSAEQLAKAYKVLSRVPFSTVVLPQCDFLHFGTTRQLITSGLELRKHDGRAGGPDVCLSLNNRVTDGGKIIGGGSWVEGCRIAAPLTLAGQNAVIGVDIDAPLELPAGACLDVIAGETRSGRGTWFVRAYHVADTFKDLLGHGATLAGRPLGEWLAAVGAAAGDIWPADIAVDARSLWDARVFPAVISPRDYRHWLWMFDPGSASAEEKRQFLQADRYSVAEIALLADMEAFYARRSHFPQGGS